MRISFDLDDTLICYGDGVACEPRLPPLVRVLLRDEPLRLGTKRLMTALRQRGHEVWIYTTSARTERWVRLWFHLHGIPLAGVVNGTRHAKCFGENSLPTKRPHAFGIHLHIDNAQGVAIEGQLHGFNVCVVEPRAADWVEQVLVAVADREFSR